MGLLDLQEGGRDTWKQMSSMVALSRPRPSAWPMGAYSCSASSANTYTGSM